MDLRPPHQQALYPQDETAPAVRPRRVRRRNPENREDRTEAWSEENPDGRWRCYDYDELVARDKTNIDIFWLRDESLDDDASLEAPDVIAADIIEDLLKALDEIALIRADLTEESATNS